MINESSISYESEEDTNRESHNKLLNAVLQLYKKQRVDAPKRREPTVTVSEFHLTNSSKNGSSLERVGINDLIQCLKNKPLQRHIHNKLKNAQTQGNKLPKPVEPFYAEKIARTVGYENLVNQVSKWDGVVDANRVSEQLVFPLEKRPEPEKYESFEFLKTFKEPSELAVNLAQVLSNSDVTKNEEHTEEKLFNLSISEMVKQRKFFKKIRAQESYKLIRKMKQNKIKSKTYRRILRKERMKEELKDFELLEKTNPEAALEKLEKLERERATERASLRHRNTGKWARGQAIRAKYDKQARSLLADQIAKSRELTQKVKEIQESTSDEEEIGDVIADTGENPWIKSDDQTFGQFIIGYQNYWKKKELNTNKTSDISKSSELRVDTPTDCRIAEKIPHKTDSKYEETSVKRENLSNVLNGNSEIFPSETSVDQVQATKNSVSIYVNGRNVTNSVEDTSLDISKERNSVHGIEKTPDIPTEITYKTHLVPIEVEQQKFPLSFNRTKKNSNESTKEINLHTKNLLRASETKKQKVVEESKDDLKFLKNKANLKDLKKQESKNSLNRPSDPESIFYQFNTQNLKHISKPNHFCGIEKSGLSENKIVSFSNSKGNHFNISENNFTTHPDFSESKGKEIKLSDTTKYNLNLSKQSSCNNFTVSGVKTCSKTINKKRSFSKSKYKKGLYFSKSGIWDVTECKGNKNILPLEPNSDGINVLFHNMEKVLFDKIISKKKNLETDEEQNNETENDDQVSINEDEGMVFENDKMHDENNCKEMEEQKYGAFHKEDSGTIGVDNEENNGIDITNLTFSTANTIKENVDRIDPKKFMVVKPHIINSEISDLTTGISEAMDDDDIEQQKINQSNLMEAFADDDVIKDFRKDKCNDVKVSQIKDIDLSLPGWGSWGGTNISHKSRRKRRFLIKAPQIYRKDRNKNNIILQDDISPQLKQHMVKEIPLPFKSENDFKASLRLPLGTTWVPTTAFKKLTKPPVMRKMGTIIEPLSEYYTAIDNKESKLKITGFK